MAVFVQIVATLLFVVQLLHLTAANCPDVNTAVNCSFRSDETCLKAYIRQDKHGLQWQSRSGRIQESADNFDVLEDSPNGGHYLAISPTPDTRAWGLWTELISPPFTADNLGCLYFSFHNRVCTDNPSEIFFRVSLMSESRYYVGCQRRDADILLREYPCINSSAWQNTKLSINGLSGIYRLVFAARQHGLDAKWIAVDDITYSDKSCSIHDDQGFTNGECDFEDSDLCGYHTEAGNSSRLQWRVVQREMFVHFQTVRKRAPEGFFLAVWGRDLRHEETLETLYAQSPKVTVIQDSCLSLTYYCGRYHRDNNNVTALVVSRVDAIDQEESFLYELPATLGDEPIKGFIPLPEGEYAIRFTANVLPPYGISPNDVIGIDDVEIHSKKCDSIRCDGAVCEDDTVQHCNGRGNCLGKGLKHKSCKCQPQYIGKHCEYDSVTSSQSRSRHNYRG